MSQRHMGFLLGLLGTICGALLVSGTSSAGAYRDKHGNPGSITFGAVAVDAFAPGIDYSVQYALTDSTGSRSGEYLVTSEYLSGRDPGSDDFVLNLLVVDAASQNAAELIFRNNPNVAPLAPVLRLLDCSVSPCLETARYDEPMWGAWVIGDQTHIAQFPIELLDTRVITQLLTPAQLSQLPNAVAGTGNWAEILENHRSNFEEARFRADIDTLGLTQSDLLTSRMIAEIAAELGTPDDWLVRHWPTIDHGALTFLTGHRDLIEDMTTTLFTNYSWPLDYSFPFGRMPAYLVDPHLDAGPDSPGVDPYHVLATHWERVIPGQAALGTPGCWHDYPANGDTPTLANASTNLGQYECTAIATPSGFIDRPCTEGADYFFLSAGGTTIGGALEGNWHNPIHGFIGGSFFPPSTTAGTMVFWAFHTYASTVVLSNWKQAQKRDMPTAFALALPPNTPYYLRSTVGAPWGQSTNEAAMDAAFGAGNWIDERYETVNVASLFSEQTVIFMEGSDLNADEMEAFVGTHLAAINTFMQLGGVIFFNAAPNEGDGMGLPDGVSQTVALSYPGISSGTTTTSVPGHPIFVGPQATVTGLTGNSFAHATISGVGLSSLLDTAAGSHLAELAIGAGRAIYGGMTTTNWHQPQPDAPNLRANILSYALGQVSQPTEQPAVPTMSGRGQALVALLMMASALLLMHQKRRV
jgi:hypothetical protein